MLRVACAALSVALAGCVSVTTKTRALLLRDDGSVAVQTLACPHAIEKMLATKPRTLREGLDPDAIRLVIFFFQAEDGIRDGRVTGVQTCALPISADRCWPRRPSAAPRCTRRGGGRAAQALACPSSRPSRRR